MPRATPCPAPDGARALCTVPGRPARGWPGPGTGASERFAPARGDGPSTPLAPRSRGLRVTPDAAGDGFPEPPVRFTDRENRAIRVVERPGDQLDDLETMYRDYDPRDRAQGIPPATAAGIRRWLDQVSDALHVVALHEDRPVGHAFLAPEPDAEATAELAIFVDGPYQEAGIGTRLMETLLGLGASRGIRRVWLVVQRSNGPAVRLYRKTGFEVLSGARAELEMERELAAPEG